MKKLYTSLLMSILFIGISTAQTRYIDQVFSAVDITPNVIYASNMSVLTGTPIAQSLPMEVYQPTGDTETSRPLIIHMHTGTFLPILYNGNPTGMRQDFATNAICEDYAKRGYVVANIEYRLGWNPTLPTQTERAASLMIAVYRAIQDCKAAVRYFRQDFEGGNTYGIDTSRIILSGQGSGGWVALGYATVNKLEDIQLPKFLDLTDPTNPIPLLDTAALGDWDGYGGNPALNLENNVGYSNDVHMVLSMGGGMGDLSWLEAGDVPMAAVHCPTDPTAIYSTGDVSVQQIGIVTTDISGSYDVVAQANALGNNASISAGSYNDPYTTAAQAASQGLVAGGFVDQNGTTITNSVDHVFPYMTGNPFESAPWDFWDSTTLVTAIAPAVGLTAVEAQGCHANGLATNPNMSIGKSLAYIDSTLGFFCPRIVNTLLLPGNTVGVQETALNTTVSIFPNPTESNITISTDNLSMSGFEIYSTAGRLVAKKDGLNTPLFELNNLDLSSGMYIVNIHFNEGIITEKLVVK